MTAQPSDAPLLALANVGKRFGSTQALDDVSLDLGAGRIHALVGENGAGKSTLVKVVAGIVQPDTGRVRLDGHEVSFADPAAAAAAGIHLVHQELALVPRATVVENVFLGRELGGRAAGLAWGRMARIAAEALGRLGVDIDVHRPVGELSTAQQQVVEIARAVAQDSRLIVLDEPTAALPPGDTERLFAVLRKLAAGGTGVVYITHRLDEVAALADEVTVLKDGRRVATAPASELGAGRLIELMVGRAVADLYPARAAPRGTETALEVADLADPPAVQAASLTVRRGEIVGLYGLEGHGQDELLACLAGARTPVRGELRLGGRERGWRQVADVIGDGVGLVPEDRKTEGLILDMTATRNVTLPVLRTLSRFGLVSAARERAAAAQATTVAGVKGDLAAPARALSGGNQQKLLLARWVAAGAATLLLNQPTRGVDVGSKAEIYRMIRALAEREGKAALVVSREIGELQGLCDRILVMSRGRLVAEHAPEATEEAILASAVGGGVELAA